MDRGGRSESCDAQAGVICRGYVGILSSVRHKNRKARWHRGVIDFVLDLQLQIRDSFFVYNQRPMNMYHIADEMLAFQTNMIHVHGAGKTRSVSDRPQ